MKAVILAGGLGTRLSEETHLKPKPMVEIGGKPIIWHIMKLYSFYGINDFIICCGYKGYVIKEYFANYFAHNSDLTISLNNNSQIIHKKVEENWKITLVDTGLNTMTGGRIKRISDFIDEDVFCMTYGDGVSNVNIKDLIKSHYQSGLDATLTAVYPPARFGALTIEDNIVTNFQEKPIGDGSLINGGFFVLSKNVIEKINDDTTVWEQEPLKELACEKQINAFVHDDFWQPMDTLRDKYRLEHLWKNNKAPWKVWL